MVSLQNGVPLMKQLHCQQACSAEHVVEVGERYGVKALESLVGTALLVKGNAAVQPFLAIFLSLLIDSMSMLSTMMPPHRQVGFGREKEMDLMNCRTVHKYRFVISLAEHHVCPNLKNL